MLRAENKMMTSRFLLCLLPFSLIFSALFPQPPFFGLTTTLLLFFIQTACHPPPELQTGRAC